MPRRKFIDKKNATTFTLVHRAHDDPEFYNEDAPSMVFTEKQSKVRRPTDEDYAYSSAGSVFSDSGEAYRSKKTRQRGDLEDEFGLSFRKNEGEAAQHGVFFDDTEYDYMQHMRELGTGEGSVMWVEAGAQQGKRKGKQRLEDALRELDVGETASVGSATQASSATRSLLPEEVLPSEFVRQRTYQDQQDVPDEIAGLQPDMDPRLREVLEALDDEAYVDDGGEDEDFFAELTEDGYEVDKGEFEQLVEQGFMDEEDEDGWESDDTIRAVDATSSPPPPSIEVNISQAAPPEDTQAPPPTDPTQGAWLDEYRKFKSSNAEAKNRTSFDADAAPAVPSILSSQASIAGRKKRRKGARTNPTASSMTASSLARTDQLTLLDQRFERMAELYRTPIDEADGDEEDIASVSASGVSDLSGVSGRMSHTSNASRISTTSSIALDPERPKQLRQDFDNILDEFLGSHSKAGKRGQRVKNFGPQSGMQQLDELRKGLGPARVKRTVVNK